MNRITKIWINDYEDENFGNWKLNLEIENLRNYLEMRFLIYD